MEWSKFALAWIRDCMKTPVLDAFSHTENEVMGKQLIVPLDVNEMIEVRDSLACNFGAKYVCLEVKLNGNRIRSGA